MKKLISIIIPVYNEEKGIQNNIQYIVKCLEKNLYDFEILLIDDGSKDNSWLEIEKIIIEEDLVTGIRFTRNFGKEAAIFAGLNNANGEACILIDSDLQHPPELIMDFIKIWEEEK